LLIGRADVSPLVENQAKISRMNLFTRYLARHNQQKSVERLIAHQDALESLVITIYKSGEVDQAQREEYRQLRRWMERHYPEWEATLTPYWRQTRVEGVLLENDPFRRVWAAESADNLIGDWGAMQHLAAAREALNRWLSADRNAV
jgi:hypothetical protein